MTSPSLAAAVRKKCCNCRNFVFCIILTVILLHLVGINKSKDPGKGLSFLERSSLFLSGFTEKELGTLAAPDVKLVKNIIIMSSNPRSGSSYTGELLSASDDSAFFFEPLWYFVDKKNFSPSFEEKKSLIMNLLKCNFHDPRIKKMLFSNKQSTFVFRKPSRLGLKFDTSPIGRMGFLKRMEIRCRRTKTRVIKTIRLNMTEMTTILDQLPEEGRVSRHNLYVVYLVRDPRGVINSVQSLKEQWPERFLDPKHICSRLLNDSVTQSNHGDKNLLVLKYEDIAERPQEELDRISQKFNLSLARTEQFLTSHNSAKWEEKRRDEKVEDPTWAPLTGKQVEENPLKEIVQDIAKQKIVHKETELEEDVVVDTTTSPPNELVNDLGVSDDNTDVSDYYDSKGNIMTLRRRRRSILRPVSQLLSPPDYRRLRSSKRKSVDADPAGRSYYYSTYRKKSFDPNHWKIKLSKDTLDSIYKDKTCRTVLDMYSYSKE